ncbi:hypothetical protein QBC34DRAFT_411727 [Podospora aff. communis PSN243]|uniref:FHA domain-containing protein n=1 Tax=Podospora aff. communis PSN243 TaxID=3040156 RepID=A0AAV9GEC3_9PEZI|nr:hypothetical protein QBC34DRAFT_411727 [Podospora aff. communis PSN243]
MAATDILFFGIAHGRDVVILPDEDSSRRDSTSIDVDGLSACHALFSPSVARVLSLEPQSPTSLLSQPLSRDALARVSAGPARPLDAKPNSVFDDDDDDDDTHNNGDILLPLDRFSKLYQRHEQIALALSSPYSRWQPYLDYVPCPGSSPGSPAISVATDYIPPAAPVTLEAPQPEPQPTLSFEDIATSSVSVNNPMARYLSDMNQPHEWLAVVMEKESTEVDAQPEDTPDSGAPRQDTPSSITLDGDNSLPDGSYLVAPVRSLTPSSTRKYEDEEEDMDDSAHTFEALATIRTKREERIMANGYSRWRRAIRMRQSDSPPRKRAKTDDRGT